MFFFFEFDKDVLPSFSQMMKPVIAALQELGGTAKIKPLDAKAIELMSLSDEQKSIIHKGSTKRTEVAYRLAWARTYLKKYGLLKNPSRGVWSLTDKFDGIIDEINPADIERQVRYGNTSDTDNSQKLTGTESVLAFENLVVAILKDNAKKQKKQWYFTYSDTVDFGYDMFFPAGIDSISGAVGCVIKYMPSNTSSAISRLVQTCIEIASKLKDEKILLILSVVLSEEMKERIKNEVFNTTHIQIYIWDNRDLVQKVDPESSYANYLINPKRALIEDTLYADLPSDEKERLKGEQIGRLKTAYRNQDIALFLGAGISIDAGIPLWSELIKQLLIQMISNKTRGRKLSKTDISMLNELAYSNQDDSPLTQIRYIKSAFSSTEYRQLVRSVLYHSNINLNSQLLNAIAKICTPRRSYSGINSIVTYNFDDLLERKFLDREIDFNSVYREDDMTAHDKLNIYHVHGYLPFEQPKNSDDSNLIFSEEEYHQVYRDAYSWSNLSQLNAFRNNTCLFVGCSMTDPNLRRLLDVAVRSGESPRHYAFLKRNDIAKNLNSSAKKKHELISIYTRLDDNIREGYYKQLGLNIIWIDDFSEIPQILLKLSD